MAAVNLVKSIYTGSDVTSLGEIASGDTVTIPAGSTIEGITPTGATGTGKLVFGSNPTLIGYTETVYTLGTSGSITLNPTNGSIQTCAAAGTTTFTDSLSAGQSIVLMLTGGTTYTINWPTTTWVGSSGNIAPTLTASTALVFWKVSSTLYGAMVGSYA